MPVRLLFPLVACVLPAFVLLTVVALLVGGLAPRPLIAASERPTTPRSGGAPVLRAITSPSSRLRRPPPAARPRRPRPGHRRVRPRAARRGLVALLLIAWATAGGGAGKIGQLLDAVLDTIIGKVS